MGKEVGQSRKRGSEEGGGDSGQGETYAQKLKKRMTKKVGI